MTAIDVRPAESCDREGWERFCSSAEGAEVGHLWGYQELLVDVFGLEVIRLVARRADAWVGVLPLVLQKSLLGRFLTSVPYLNYAGVLGSDRDGRVALAGEALDLARRLRADRLELRGRRGDDLPIETWGGKSSYVSDLPAESKALWNALGSKVRAQVRRAWKEGCTARHVGRGGHGPFYPLLARRWHELGSPVLPERFFEALEVLLGDRLEYVLVEKDGRQVAAGLIVESVDGVEIPWAASAREHNRYGVNMLLYWSALERAVARGARRFNYGRSTPGTGNARFKLQWGAREEALQWNVYYGSRKGRASERGAGSRGLAAAVWRKLPAFFALQLGPRLAARIPL